MTDDASTPHAELELRLASLASRRVLQAGAATARRELSLAACRAEQSLLRIAALASGVTANEQVQESGAPGGWSSRHARPLATKFLRQTAVRAGSARESAATDLQHSPTPDLAGRDEDATQLFMLLALNRATPADSTGNQSVATARELLALLLPPDCRTRYLGQPPTAPPKAEERLGTFPWMLALYSAAIVAYLLVRFRGRYVEQDTAEMTQLVKAVAAYGSAIPAAGALQPVYPFGFGFQAVNVYLLRLSGASIETLQAWVWPFLLVAIALLAFLAFREMTDDPRVAALGGLLLFMQPDFLFTALRGSHEKMTYCLLFAAFFLLFRSYRYRNNLAVFTGHVLLFYLVLFGILCTNSFFGSSLIAALTLSFLGGVFLSRFLGRETGGRQRGFTRLAYVSSSSLLLLLVDLLYLYQPSSSIAGQFRSLLDRLAGLFLGFGANANPYSAVSLDWSNPAVYLLLTACTWFTIAVSAAAWCRRTAHFITSGWSDAADHVRLRWLLYAGFALQVGVGIVIDFAGVLGANLQLRLFPIYVFIAVPTASAAVIALFDRVRVLPGRRRTVRFGAAATALLFSVFSVLKATNEPLLSNKWTFYSAAEAQTMDWLAREIPDGVIWTDVDERLREAYLFRSPPTTAASYRYTTMLSPDRAALVMLSDITRARMARMAMPLPDVAWMNEIYDDGQVQVYKRLPQTALQR